MGGTTPAPRRLAGLPDVPPVCFSRASCPPSAIGQLCPESLPPRRAPYGLPAKAGVGSVSRAAGSPGVGEMWLPPSAGNPATLAACCRRAAWPATRCATEPANPRFSVHMPWKTPHSAVSGASSLPVRASPSFKIPSSPPQKGAARRRGCRAIFKWDSDRPAFHLTIDMRVGCLVHVPASAAPAAPCLASWVWLSSSSEQACGQTGRWFHGHGLGQNRGPHPVRALVPRVTGSVPFPWVTFLRLCPPSLLYKFPGEAWPKPTEPAP